MGSLPPSASTPYGSEGPSWPPSPPSSRCGSPSRSTTSPAPPSCTASASKRFKQQQQQKQKQQHQQQQQYEAKQPLRDDHKLCNNPLSHCSNFVVSCWLISQLLLHPFLTTKVSSLLFITFITSTTNTVDSPPLALCPGQGFSSVCSYLVPRGNLAQRLC